MYRFLLSRLRARFCVKAVFFSFLTVLAAPPSWGLGLGEIETQSALNQRFKATIELFDAAALEPAEILVSLGSGEDFERVGVERFFFLTDLRFEVTRGPRGESQISVTSNRPVTEPYLNFLVEVLWPNGRLLKEYTVLLDPPTFSDAAAPAVSAPQQDRTTADRGRVQRVEPASRGTQVQVAPGAQAAEPSPLDQGLTGDEYGMTDRDDTMWSIASRSRRGGASVQQTMLAIQKLNPEAFINGNINLLKAGYVLRLPSEGQALALSAEDALGEVARHDSEWRAFNRGEAVADRGSRASSPTVDSTSDQRSPMDASATTTPANRVAPGGGELQIVAEDGDSTTGVGNQVASVDLDAALEETDRLGRRVDELTYQLDREKELATNEIAVKDRQIEVKDQQIAELQAQLAAAQQQAQQVQNAAPPQNQNQSTPAEVTAPWWQSPIVMYGGAGTLVLLLVGGMVAARKRRANAEENDYFDAEEAFSEAERHEPALSTVDREGDEDEDERPEAAADQFDEELEGSQTSDVIGEADIYIAYGRFTQAIGLLMGVLEDDPERNDARLKLLEVYAETGDRAAFDHHMTSLVEYCDDEDALESARELEAKLGESSITLDDMMADERESGAKISPATASDEDAEPAEIEFSSGPAADSTPLAGGKVDKSRSLDFELELDDLDANGDTSSMGDEASSDEVEELQSAGAGDELGGDLGIDFDPGEAPDSNDDEQKESYDFESLSLDDEGETEELSGRGAGRSTSDELTIDADLEEAAFSIRSGAAEQEADADEGDLALETSEDENLLDDLEFESATRSDEEFDFEDEGDSANTKLDLARAYIDMGDADGARDILKEVLGEGNSDQQQKAKALLESL